MSGASGVGVEVLWHTKRYLESLERLRRADRGALARVARIEQGFFDDLHGLQRSPLANPKRTIYHTRIDRGRRLIDEPLSSELAGQVALLFAGAHDAANEFGATYRADTLAQLKRAVRVERSPNGSAPATSGDSAAAPPELRVRGTYGEVLSLELLRECGVPDEKVAMVAGCPSSVSLGDLDIPAEVEDRVIAAFYSLVPSSPVKLPVPGAEAPAAVQARADQVVSLLRMPLHLFMAQLSEEQRSLAERPMTGPVIIQGAAGSGKTIVGIRRLERLVTDRSPDDSRPILFTCYNRVLAHAVEQMVVDILGATLQQLKVEVRTIYSFYGHVARAQGTQLPDALAPSQLTKAIQQARTLADVGTALDGLSDAVLLTEFQDVIEGRALTDESDYLEADRAGMRIPLTAARRSAVWRVFTAFRDQARRSGRGLWESSPAILARTFERDGYRGPRYFGAVIDEAQDLTPAGFRVVTAALGGDTQRLFVFGDVMQSVYRRGFRWKYTGLGGRGRRIHQLRRVYRSTPAIVSTFRPLAEVERQGVGEDVTVPLAGGDPGHPVTLRRYSNEEAQYADVAERIVNLVIEGEPASAIAVVTHSVKGRQRIKELLLAWGVPVEDQDDDGRRGIDIFAASVKLLSPPSAKGMEFPVLFLLDVVDRWYGCEEGPFAPIEDVGRRTLYMAALRAGYLLHVGTVKGKESAHLECLDRTYLVESPDA